MLLTVCSVSARDFTIIGLPDTQYYTGHLFGGTPEIFQAQTQWIVDNKDSLNIVFVAHLGDVVEFGFREIEWRRADEAMRILEDPQTTGLVDGIPFGLVLGNHDLPSQLYNRYFGIERFSGRDYYGGHYGRDNDNHFTLFSSGDLNLIAIFFEYTIQSGSPVLAWADSLLDVYSNRRAIIVHHSAAIGQGHPPDDKGEIIYEALKRHSGFFLLLCGHWGQEEWRGQVTFEGQTVYSLLSDYQTRNRGGDGWLRIMEFQPDHNLIWVKTYSPTLDRFETDESSQFTLPYDMQSPTGISGEQTVPADFLLLKNYPNPFNTATTIHYTLPVQSGEFRVKGGEGTLHSEPFTPHVTLKIFNVMGQEVAILRDEVQEPGSYTVTWDASDAGSGVYFCRLSIDNGRWSATKRMVVVK